MKSLIPYIGGKHRIAPKLIEFLRRDGLDLFVDVFGGSGAMTMAAASVFPKLVYNDASGDLVNLFRCIADDVHRVRLVRILKAMPPSRKLWNEYSAIWNRGGYTFALIPDPVERAAATFYRHHFAFGGKVSCGGMQISTGDRHGIKEPVRIANAIRRLGALSAFWRRTMIEQGDALKLVSLYGEKPNAALYIDPPYDGTERYYSESFSQFQATMLASALASCKAHVVVSYYDTPMIRSLYPETVWEWHSIQATKNGQFRGGYRSATESVIVKRDVE